MLVRISAWGAIVVGALLAALGAVQVVVLNAGLAAAPLTALGASLLAGGGLVLANRRRGARLLAGAWGVLAGMFLGSDVEGAIRASLDPAWGQGSAAGIATPFMLALSALPYVALGGLLLAVLHKRRSPGDYLGDKPPL